jgi:hypothetical protein
MTLDWATVGNVGEENESDLELWKRDWAQKELTFTLIEKNPEKVEEKWNLWTQQKNWAGVWFEENVYLESLLWEEPNLKLALFMPPRSSRYIYLPHILVSTQPPLQEISSKNSPPVETEEEISEIHEGEEFVIKSDYVGSPSGPIKRSLGGMEKYEISLKTSHGNLMESSDEISEKNAMIKFLRKELEDTKKELREIKEKCEKSSREKHEMQRLFKERYQEMEEWMKKMRTDLIWNENYNSHNGENRKRPKRS